MCIKTLHPLADLFILAPTRFLWEAFSHAAVTAKYLFTHISPPLSMAEYSSIQLIELGRREENENTRASKRQQRGFERELPRLRVQRSSAALPVSKQCMAGHIADPSQVAINYICALSNV